MEILHPLMAMEVVRNLPQAEGSKLTCKDNEAGNGNSAGNDSGNGNASPSDFLNNIGNIGSVSQSAQRCII